MKLRLIACKVFEPELEHLLPRITDEIDTVWLPLRAHDQPDVLRSDLQDAINATPGDVDAVILAYGLCGNATEDIRAGEVPLFIPRAHDCSQILLGSRETWSQRFSENPSRPWTSVGYLRGENEPVREGGSNPPGYDLANLIREYGEENGRYVWETMRGSDDDPVLYYLDVPETRDEGSLQRAREVAEERNKVLEMVPATLETLEQLLGGKGGMEILLVPPGAAITPTWDENVIAAEGRL